MTFNYSQIIIYHLNSLLLINQYEQKPNHLYRIVFIGFKHAQFHSDKKPTNEKHMPYCLVYGLKDIWKSLQISTVGGPLIHEETAKIVHKGPCKKRAFSAKNGSLTDSTYDSLIFYKIIDMLGFAD